MVTSIFDILNAYFMLFVAIILLWYYSQSTYDFWLKLNVKFLKPIPFFGNTVSFVLQQKSLHETVDILYQDLFDEPYGGYYQFREPILLVKDPELISTILIRDFKHFQDRQISFFFNARKDINPLSVNLATITGERWKVQRQKMSPLFSTTKVRQMCDQIFDCVDLLTEYIDEKMDSSGSMDIPTKKLFDKLTIDVIGCCAFGIECNSLKSNEKFAEMCEEIFKPRFVHTLRLITSALSERLLTWFNFRDYTTQVNDFFFNLSLDTVTYRRQTGTTRKDFLQLLIALQNSHSDPKFAVQNNDVQVLENEKFDEIDLSANLFLFFLAGFETTSATLSFCFYELALNQEIQNRLRSEIQQIHQKYETINYDSLKEMTYLNAVIDETLRKYPPITTLYRTCTGDYIIPKTNVEIPAGTKIMIPIWSIQHDCRNYPNPEVFDPERFLGDNKQSRKSGAYLPFGDGPRFCIGKYFSETELKATVAVMILKYDIKPSAKTQSSLAFKEGTPFLNAKPEIWINLSERTF